MNNIKLEKKYDTDILVVGGGMAGICAAIQASRLGSKVTLVDEELFLGGCSSSLFRLRVDGAGGMNHEYGRETGIIEELEADGSYYKTNLEPNTPDSENSVPMYGFKNDIWSYILKQKCEDAGVNVLLKTAVFDVVKEGNRINYVKARDLKIHQVVTIKINSTVIDASGDGIVAYKAGAEYMLGQEAREEYNESYAPEKSNKMTMGDALMFFMVDKGKPVKFTPPPGMPVYKEDKDLPMKVCVIDAGKEHAGFSGHSAFTTKCVLCVIWTAEYGGHLNILEERNSVLEGLIKMVFGIVDHIKNQQDHGAENYELIWVTPKIGRREGRRFKGDYILSQKDLLKPSKFKDAVAYGGRVIDLHEPDRDGKFVTVTYYALPPLYSIPYRCLYSKDIDNLMLAGRLISGTRIALGSYRVQKTLATTGQAAGAAAHLACKYNVSSRELCDEKYITELQQTLLRYDATILGVNNEDKNDLARTSKVSAISETKDGEACNVINGVNRQFSSDDSNMWISDPNSGLPQMLYIDLQYKKEVSCVQLTFDTALNRARESNVDARVFKETVRDYRIQYLNNHNIWEDIISVKENYQRFRIHKFNKVITDKIRIIVEANNEEPGNSKSNVARIFEVRVYS
jgi:hypothetical protein